MQTISFAQMVNNLAKPGQTILKDLTARTCHLLHMAIGMMGEVLELQTGLLKSDAVNVNEEIGDLMFYTQGICTTFGFDGPEIMIHYDLSAGNNDDLISAVESVADRIKKHVFYGKEIDENALRSDIESVVFFAKKLLDDIGKDLGTCLTNNKEKLGKRFPGHVYSNEAAIDRKDKKPDE